MIKDEVAEIRDLLNVTDETPGEESEEQEDGTEEDEDENLAEETGTEETVAEDDAEEEESEESEEGVLDESYTVASLTKAIEMEADEFYKVMIPMSDGQEPVSIGDMKNQYQQSQRDVVTLQTTIDEQKALIDGGQTPGAMQQQMSQQEIAAQVEMAALQREYQAMNFEELEASEPGVAALQRQKFQERYNAAQNVLQQSAYYRQQQDQEHLSQAHNQMLEMIPEWKNDETKQSDQALMNTMFLDAGYSQEMINGIVDPIAMKLARELVLLRNNTTQAKKVLKKVKTGPRPLKSGAMPQKNKKGATEKLVAKAKQTRNKTDEFNAVKQILSGG